MNSDSFWRKVIKTETCWNWAGPFFASGYGIFSQNGVNKAAHRVSWELSNGVIPSGLIIRHVCDNRVCVRPDHLLIGTHGDNNRDKESRGRGNHTFGNFHGRSKLREELVSQAREEYRNGARNAHLAKKYAVDSATMYDALIGKTWKHVPVPCLPQHRIVNRPDYSKIASARPLGLKPRSGRGRSLIVSTLEGLAC